MADLEVENTLREIRERVLADARLRAPVAAAANGEQAGRGGNGASDGGARPSDGASVEALARLDANLATTARAWSRLPPLLTYRSGAAARLELWLKRLVKRAAHWFTWEQVNFNSATHHALGDVRAVLVELRTSLAAEGQARESAREELLAEIRAGRAEAEADRARLAELQARLAHAEARFEAGAAGLRQALAAALERLAEEQRAAAAEALAAQRTAAAEQGAQIEARAAELHEEMRRRADELLEEQRVCFKQLSLEASEAAVTHDRARRQLEARLEALEKKSGV